MTTPAPPSPPPVNAQREHAWSRYWQSGALHSCVGSFGGNYEGEIAAYWREFIAGLGPDTSGVDIGCGNAPFAELLCQSLVSERVPTVHLLDAATIAPPWLARLDASLRERIIVHPRTRVESMPFASASLDWAVSQFGIEYSDLERSMGELLRVLTADAQIALILHATDSALAGVAREEVAHLDWLLDSTTSPLTAAAGMLEPLSRLADPAAREALRRDPLANRLRAEFNTRMRALEARGVHSQVPDLLLTTRDALAQIVAQVPSAGCSWGDAQLQRYRQQLLDAHLRSGELLRHALDAPMLEKIADRLRRSGRTVTTRAIHHQEHKMGWALLAYR